MPDKVVPGPVQDSACIREAVCIHTKKIFDSCKEKDTTFYRISPHMQSSQTFPSSPGLTSYQVPHFEHLRS